MTTTLAGAVGLMPPGHDPRPCVNKPAQWWDLGNEHNPRAIRYCRNVCPLRQKCKAEISDETQPKGQIRAGYPYNEYGKQLTVCPHCDTPRTRIGTAGVPVCGCTPNAVRAALTAARHAGLTPGNRERLLADYRSSDPIVAQWLPLYQQGHNVREAATVIGVSYDTLKSALRRARTSGDQRVPLFRQTGSQKQVAA